MKFDKLKYSEHEKAINEIDRLFHLMENKFILLGMEYANKISGELDNKQFYLFRNSVLRRLGAALFHYDLLAKINVSGSPISFDGRDAPPDAFYVTVSVSYLFDSIIFHIASAFDYYAGLVKYISYGNYGKWKTTWGDVVKQIDRVPTLSASKLGNEILNVNKEFVKDLIAYRGGLIHNNIESPQFAQRTKIFSSQSIVNIFPPLRFIRMFESHLSGNKDSTLNEISLWLLDSSICSLLKLQEATSLYFDVNRRTRPGDEIVTFSPKSK